MSVGPPARPPRARPTPELIAPGSILWELTGQRLYIATTGSAFVLQVMHPAIGTVVDQHRASGLTWSTFDEHRLRALGTVTGRVNAVLPERGKYMDIAHDARRAVRAAERLDRTLAARPL